MLPGASGVLHPWEGFCTERIWSQKSLGIPLFCPHERGSKKAVWRKLTLKFHICLKGSECWSSGGERQGFQVQEEGRVHPAVVQGRRAQLLLPLQWPKVQRGISVEGRSLGQKPYISIQKESPGLLPPSSCPPPPG